MRRQRELLGRGIAPHLLIGAVVVAVLPWVGVGFAAESPSRQKAKLTFTTKTSDRSSGLRLRIDYRDPADPSGKPPAVRRVVQRLARGSRIDTTVPARCRASDATLMLLGAAACPAGSQVGEGVLTLDTGLVPRTLTADVTFLNAADELILLSTLRGSAARVVTRSAVGRRSITAEVPLLPGAPPDGTAIDVVRADLGMVESANGRGRYISTPRRCRDRGWKNAIRFSYADEVSQTVTSRTRCR